MIPRTLTNFNVTIDGEGYVGKAETVTLPKVAKKLHEHFTSGMSAPVDVPVGYEKLEADVTFAEATPELVQLMNRNEVNAFPARFTGIYVNPQTGETSDIEVTLVGYFTELDSGNMKRGEQPQPKVMIKATHYKYVDAGSTLIEIDTTKPFGS